MAGNHTLYIGTYTRPEGHVLGRGEGIYIYQYEATNGRLTYQATMLGATNPSYIAINRKTQTLYAANELANDGETGRVSAYAIAPRTHNLTYLNTQATAGLAPCYVSVAEEDQFVLAANYVTGNIIVIPVAGDGRLKPPSDEQQFQGSGPHPRQAGPHAHSAITSPDGRFVLAADLGTDKIMLYRLDKENGRLIPAEKPWIKVKPGSGPRHLVFHPNGRCLYLVNELSSEVVFFTFDPDLGTLIEKQTISTLPPDFQGSNTAADVQLTPDGRFLYASNRGHDSIAMYGVKQDSGRLSLIGFVPVLGKTPRNFAIDPAGNFLLVANQDSDSVVSMRIDNQTGSLEPTGEITQIPSPVCLKFLS